MVGFAFAGVTGPPTTSPSTIVKIDDKLTLYTQHLRDTRKLLNDAKDTFDKDPADQADHRKEILEGTDKAITAVDAEIDEYKGAGAK